MIIDSLEILTVRDTLLVSLENTTKIQFRDKFNFIYGEDNSVGKSTLLECINFCLGSNARKVKNGGIDPQLFCCRDPLKNLFLSLSLTHENNRKSIILRNTTEPYAIYIHNSSYLYEQYKDSYSFEDTDKEELAKYKAITNTSYRNILEKEIFNCPSDFSFKFRTLIEYSLRVVGHPWDAFYKNSREKLAIQILYLLKFPDLNWAVKYNDSEFKKIKNAVNKVILSSLEIKEDNFDSALEVIVEKINETSILLENTEKNLDTIKTESENESLWDEIYQLRKERSLLYNQKRPLEQELRDLREQVQSDGDIDYSNEIKEALSEASIVFSLDLLSYIESVSSFHNSVLQDRMQDILERVDFLEQSIALCWSEINTKTESINAKEESIKDTADARIINDVQVTIEAYKSELNKLNSHKKLLENILEEIPKLQDHKKKSKEWIKKYKTRLDSLSTEFKEWSSSVYQGDYEEKNIELYRDGNLYFDLFGGLGNAEGEASKILFDVWLLKNSPFMKFLIHDTQMFHGIEDPHINSVMDIIMTNINKQYIFSLNKNESQFLNEEQLEFLKNNTIVKLTHSNPLFGIRC